MVKYFGFDSILVQYKNKKLEKLCRDYKKAQKELNAIVAEKLHALINLLESVEKLQDIHDMRIYNLHPLHGTREGQYALDLGRRLGFRLIIIPLDEEGKACKEKDVHKIYNATKIALVWEVSNHYE